MLKLSNQQTTVSKIISALILGVAMVATIVAAQSSVASAAITNNIFNNYTGSVATCRTPGQTTTTTNGTTATCYTAPKTGTATNTTTTTATNGTSGTGTGCKVTINGVVYPC